MIANLSNSDIELITRNSQILFELHQRIVERLNLVEEELKWISSSETRNDTMEDEVKFREAAGRIAQIYLDEVNFSSCFFFHYVRGSRILMNCIFSNSFLIFHITMISVLGTVKL